GETPQKVQMGCCAMDHAEGCSADPSTDPPVDHRESCPCCEHRKDPRDSAKRLILSQKPEAERVLHLAGWQEGLPAIQPELSMKAEAPRHERGPPAEPPRLFLHHGALLL
ncbi:MAG: hypothetical protein ACKO8Z_02205, partial [Prosthecobacter sp.]